MIQNLWLATYSPKRNATLNSLAVALEGWKRAWDFQVATLTSAELQRYGFTRHASIEFWQLASMMVKEGRTQIDAEVDNDVFRNDSGLNPVQKLLQDMSKGRA